MSNQLEKAGLDRLVRDVLQTQFVDPAPSASRVERMYAWLGKLRVGSRALKSFLDAIPESHVREARRYLRRAEQARQSGAK